MRSHLRRVVSVTLNSLKYTNKNMYTSMNGNSVGITNITIQNIKGFSGTNNSIDLHIKEGKVNLLVAPNGFGKSSMATALNSLKRDRLDIESKNYHKEDDSLEALLSITENNRTYTADLNRNEISQRFEVEVIKSRLKTKTIRRNRGSFTSAEGYLDIENFIVYQKIPDNCSIPYSIRKQQQAFGANGRVLPNISSILHDDIFFSKINLLYESLDKFELSRRKRIIEQIKRFINSMSGNRDYIITNFDMARLAEIAKDSHYLSISECIKISIPSLSDLEVFLYFYQLQQLYSTNKSNFRAKSKRAKYNLFRRSFDENLNKIGRTWRDIRTVEENNRLVVKMPKAENLSYGQRDVLTLCIELQRIKSGIKDGDRLILVIDEVFDYLDPVNMTIVQYYLSQMIEEFRRRCTLYLIVMTHLDPIRFENYSFSKKRMNISYLFLDSHIQVNPQVRKLLEKRQDELIRDEVAKYLFHYSDGRINKRQEFRRLGLPETWGEGIVFLEHVISEVNKYLGNLDFDPYSVCIGLRIRIEKIICDKLVGVAQKERFLNIHNTKEKLEYAETMLEALPDIYYMLGIIYNDTLHLRPNSEKPIIYRLANILIKEMISEIFEYKDGVHLTLAAIH